MTEGAICYVYIHFRPPEDGGAPFYVGMGMGKRWKEHFSKTTNPHANRIIAKAKREGKETSHTFVTWEVSREQAWAVEILMIAIIGRKDRGRGPLVNLTDGGEGASGAVHTPEQRAKHAAAARAAWQDPKKRAKHAAALQTPEARAKHAAALRAAWQDPEWRANTTAARQTPEYRAKHAAATRAACQTPAWRANNAAAMRAAWQDPEYRANQAAAARKLAQTPEWQANHAAAMRKVYQDPEWWENQAAAVRAACQTPEWRANHAAAMRKLAEPTVGYLIGKLIMAGVMTDEEIRAAAQASGRKNAENVTLRHVACYRILLRRLRGLHPLPRRFSHEGKYQFRGMTAVAQCILAAHQSGA